MLVGANDVDSTGNGTICAFGNGSADGLVANAACLLPAGAEGDEATDGDAAAGTGGVEETGGGAATGGGALGASGEAGFATAGFFVRGRSHFSQRIPCEICVPHITH